MKFSDFIIPESLDEALSILRELGDQAFPVAGATAFQYLPDAPGKTAVDITRTGLSGITLENDSFLIGATTTLTDLVRYHADGWVLDEVARLIPTNPIRNVSTVGGNIARVFPWSDLPLALLVLDGTITIRGEAVESIAAVDFFHSQPRNLFAGGKLVTSIDVPVLGDDTGFAYRKESVTYMAFSMMSAAARLTLDEGRMRNIRLAVGAAVPEPHRLPSIENALELADADERVLDEAIEAGAVEENWSGKHGMSDEYAAHLARVVIKDALTAALARAKGEAHG